MDEINRKPLVDVLAELLGTQVVMDGDNYVTMADNKLVADAVVADAVVKQKELYQEALLAKVKAGAQAYLLSTDWVEPYLIKHYTGIELLPADSNKFVIEQKRKEARLLLA